MRVRMWCLDILLYIYIYIYYVSVMSEGNTKASDSPHRLKAEQTSKNYNFIYVFHHKHNNIKLSHMSTINIYESVNRCRFSLSCQYGCYWCCLQYSLLNSPLHPVIQLSALNFLASRIGMPGSFWIFSLNYWNYCVGKLKINKSQHCLPFWSILIEKEKKNVTTTTIALNK